MMIFKSALLWIMYVRYHFGLLMDFMNSVETIENSSLNKKHDYKKKRKHPQEEPSNERPKDLWK